VTDRETTGLEATTVAALARLLGYPPLDAETAARIAAGASNAVAAVRATATVPLFDAEPGNYLAELERLAGPGP
jgi:hypothetical protein